MAKNKSSRTTYSFRVEKTKTGFSAHTGGQHGLVSTTGGTLEEVRKNAAEAMSLARGVATSPRSIRLHIDLRTFFKEYKILKAGPLAERVNMSPSLLSRYMNGKKKPSEVQLRRINAGIREIAGELTGLSFS